jgi:hypothetical protein
MSSFFARKYAEDCKEQHRDGKEHLGILPLTPSSDQAIDTPGAYPGDIVAVHGLTGDAYSTWTHENGQLWLRDFIPKFLPDARVFSWGYNTDVFGSLTNASFESLVRSPERP